MFEPQGFEPGLNSGNHLQQTITDKSWFCGVYLPLSRSLLISVIPYGDLCHQ